MRTGFHRVAMAVTLLAAGGSLMFTSNLGCESFMGESLMTSLDFCFIFDCSNGLLGGTVKPCQQGVDALGDQTGTLFLDCPTDENP
ncbi:MAG TPA: hypothetical protein PKK06_13465 [Phycisphaerae bacterium]|nr:hypothetical protein [Phycisphaerae bacterium]HNU46095.1 hypothetical protein [Phycisphaerae bacterium]